MTIAAIVFVGSVAAVVDLRTRRVPNWLTLGTAVCGIALTASQSGAAGATAAATGLVVGMLVMLPGHILGGTGGGDVKLLAAMGTLLGPHRVLFAFAYSAIVGAVLALFVAARRGRLQGTIGRSVALILTRGANAEEIENQSGNRFAFAP